MTLANTRFGLLVGAVVGFALIGGSLRLWLDQPDLSAISPNQAAALVAQCLPGLEIAANTPVSLAKLDAADAAAALGTPPAATLRYQPGKDAAGKDPTGERIDEPAQPAGTDPAELPKGTKLKISGGEFVLQGSAVLRKQGGRPFVLRAPEPLRFKPAEGATYVVTVLEAAKAPLPTGSARALPPDLKAEIALPSAVRDSRTVEAQPLALVTGQPAMVRPWLEGLTPALAPVRATTPRGMNVVQIEANQPGLNFAAAGVSLTACAWTDKPPAPIGIAETQAPTVGAATVLALMPPSMVPAFSSKTVHLAMASADGQFVAYGGFSAIGRGWAGLLSTAVVAGLFAGMAGLRYQALRLHKAKRDKPGQTWFASLFIGADNAPSLSLFQIFFWTVITVWGLGYVYVVTGSLLNVTSTMLTLLGIAGTGTVLARWIGGATEAPATAAPASDDDYAFGDMLSTNGQFDLLKLQLFVFTLMIGAYVVWKITDTGAFPDLDVDTLLLLGVSQGLYIGGKLTGTTAFNQAQTAKLDLDLQTARKQQLDTGLAQLKADRAAEAAKTAPDGARLAQFDAKIKDAETELATVGKRIDELTAKLQKLVKDLGLAA